MKLLTVWGVHTENTNWTEGPPTHFFDTEAKAKVFAKGTGFYGSDAPIRSYGAVNIDGEIWLVKDKIVLESQ